MKESIENKEKPMINGIEVKVGQIWEDGYGNNLEITKIEPQGDYPIIGKYKWDGFTYFTNQGIYNRYYQEDLRNLTKLVKDVEPEKEKEMKLIEIGKKYKTKGGIPVEVIYTSYKPGSEVIGLMIDTYGENSIVCWDKYGMYRGVPSRDDLVEVDILQELSECKEDTLVRITRKSGDFTALRYLKSVDLECRYIKCFNDGKTSKTAEYSNRWDTNSYDFEIIERK